MTEFKDERTGDRIEIEGRGGMVGVTTRFGDTELHTYFDAALWPAIAAEGLEAYGVELKEDAERLLDEYDVVRYSSPAIAESDLRAALFYLKRAAAIREYHAKPRVTQAQVETVRQAISEPVEENGPFEADYVRATLQAALDSGVLQVPADNKEGE